MRLIDAEKLAEYKASGVSELTEWQQGWNDAFDTIMGETPTVDAVPVVRCKECKYMTEHYDIDGNVPYWTCSQWDSGTDYDGYCHYGERREDGGRRR